SLRKTQGASMKSASWCFMALAGVLVGGLFVLASVGTGCLERDPLYCDADAQCVLVPGRTKCDLTGEHDSDNISHTCELPWAGSDIDAKRSPDGKLCTASSVSCSNDVLEVCGPEGTVVSTEKCGLGCASNTRCYDVTPSNGLAPLLDLAHGKPAVELLDGTVIDTDTGVVKDASGKTLDVSVAEAPQTGAPSIRVLMAGAFKIHDVRARGSHALAFVSPGTIEIVGNL